MQKAQDKLIPYIKRALFLCLIVLPSLVSGQESYKFERMWPTLTQPWYFNKPQGMAIAPDGTLYVADSSFLRIRKFTQDGHFITSWGSEGSEDGEFGSGTWNQLPSGPKGIAVGIGGNVYVTDTFNHRIQKFTSDGVYLDGWGEEGVDEGQFQFPAGIAIDTHGYVYVSDYENHRIQKFTFTGTFVRKWGRNGGDGSYGTGDREFHYPSSVAIDSSGFVYVADQQNRRIQKFTSDGIFLAKWDNLLPGGARFGSIHDITTDGNSNVYVTDRGYDPWNEGVTYPPSIHKLNSDGQLIGRWELPVMPSGVAANENYVYVTNVTPATYGITKITVDGTAVNVWDSYETGEGQLRLPEGIAVSGDGKIYATDNRNNCIHVYTAEGVRISPPWGEEGSNPGQFQNPLGIAIDESGNVYVCDHQNHRIQKFTQAGQVITTWGGENGVIMYPEGIALDGAGNVYVTSQVDMGLEISHRVQKFAPNLDGTTYTFENMWDEWGDESNRLEFDALGGIGIGRDESAGEFVYVAEKLNNFVHKFTLDGGYITTWTGPEVNDTFDHPWGIAADETGNVYMVDSYNSRILKITSEGQFVTSMGSLGTGPGQMGEFHYIAVDSNEKVYVADKYNNRIQVFTKIDELGNSRAVIVAGGGPYTGNHLWDATQMTASFAYRTLLHQGFTNGDIYYLSEDSDLDIDGDGVADVYDYATSENLKMLLEDLSEDDEVDRVLLYMSDHGGEDTFRMSGEEILHVSNNVDNPGHDLASWLDMLTPKRVTVVYDACQSGSFIDDLEGDDRIIITSSGSDEQAKFLNQGTISFSHFFWTGIFKGSRLREAYEGARDAVNIISDQTSNMWWDELNIDLENAYIGNHVTGMIGDAPIIEGEIIASTEDLTIETSAVLSVNGVVDPNNDAITRVWAVVWPPDYETGPTDDPLLDLPTVDLYPVGGNTYAAPFNEFHSIGNYRVTIYAMDEHGNTSPPRDTIVSRNVSRKAIIVAGGAGPGITHQMIEQNAELAYNSLISQHYDPDDNIYFMSVTGIPGFDAEPSSANLNAYLQGLVTEGDIENLDLTIYFIGGIDDGAFIINDDPDEYETLSASQLDEWLSALQEEKPGRVTVICDFDRSGSFIREHTLLEGRQRVTVAGTGDESAAYFYNEGNISFSYFFWSQVAGGATLGEAFIYANKGIAYCIRKNDISFSCYNPQSPLLDANNNGIPNEQADYDLVEKVKIGDGIISAADPPIIGAVSVVRDGEMITIIAKDISTTLPIDRVWAVLRPIRYCPGTSEGGYHEIEEVDMSGPDSAGRYVIDYPADYACTVTVYAMSLDTDGEPNISMGEGTKIHREGGDIYEPDDRSANANVIVVNHTTPQPHTFDDPDDIDWVKFYGVAGQTYVIEAINLGANCPVIEIYSEEDLAERGNLAEAIDGMSEFSVVGDKAWFDFPCIEDGIYYVKLFWGGCSWEDVMKYDLQVHDGNVGLTAIVRGKVRDRVTGEGIDGAVIRSSGVGVTISTHGEYILSEIPGDWKLRARKSDYTRAIVPIRIDSADQQIRKDIRMTPRIKRCSEDADCVDEDYCNGIEVCVDEVCQPGTDPCGDDGLYCNGEEVGCDEGNDICDHSGSPCPGHQACIEESNECVDKECATHEECDDGRFCNGTETCAGGFCQAGIDPCAEPTPECDEKQDICVEGPSIQLFPNPHLQLRWMPLLMFLRIVGTNTHFDGPSEVTFDPPDAVMALTLLGDSTHLFLIGLIMPSWLVSTQSVNVTVKTGSEILSEVLNLNYLSFMLGEER